MKLTVVGCSPAWPNPGSAHSGYLVEAEGSRLLVDCGPGVLSRLRERDGWPRIDAIVISHFHLDHFGDLVPWVWGGLADPSRTGLELWVPPAGKPQLMPDTEKVFAVSEYADGLPFEAAGFHVTPVRVLHYTQPTWGLRIERGGKTLAYSADTAPAPALSALARDADVFLCEATLGEDAHDSEPRGHMKASEAEAAARAANAKRLILVHRPIELGSPDGIEVARDGSEIEL